MANRIIVREIDWEKAKEVVSKKKHGKWYEDYDESEGMFMGWRKCKSDNIVTFSEFLKFWKTYLNGNI